MANTPSAKKSIRIQERRRKRNASIRSAVKTSEKEFVSKLAANPEEAQKAAKQAISQLDKALAKGIVHRNKSARKKSRIMKKLNLLAKNK